MRRLLSAFLATAALAAPAAAPAQKIDIDAIRAQAQASAGEFAELRALLADPDVNLRLAAFDAMVAHGDPSLYEIAVTTGLADVNEVVQSRALWESLSRRKSLILQVDPEGTLSGDAKAALDNQYQGQVILNVTQVFPDVKCLNFAGASECRVGFSADVAGLMMIINSGGLTGELTLGSDGILRGEVRDGRQVFPVALALR
jgi:hypothetical protein